MALLPRGGSGNGDGNGLGGFNGININMDYNGCCGDECCDNECCCDGGGGSSSGGGGGGGVSVHNELDGLQGGKANEYFHLTEAEYLRLPIKPTIMSPANGATGINQVPQIVGSPYSHPWDVPMRAKHCQIATDAAFGNVVWEEEAFSASVVFQVLLKPDNSPYVSPNTKYYARIRYQDRYGRWSEWSDASSFTTMAVFPDSVILTPVMLMPVEGGELPPVDPILAMSSPKVIAGSANFDAADWQITNDQSWASTLYSVSESEDVRLHVAEGVNLATALGATFYARGRQRTSDGEWSPWAVPVSFVPRPDYDDPVFGMRRIFSKKYGQPYVWNIDPEGNQVYIPPSYFETHPLYAFPVQDLPIGDTGLTSNVAFVRPCWIKLNVYDNEDGDMVMDLWFSATPQTGDGWILHPAFAEAQDGFWHGTCLATLNKGADSKNYAVSKVGEGVYANVSLETLMTIDPKWHIWTLYERRLLLDLMMAEHLTFDASKVSLGSGRNNTDESFRWRAFYGLLNINQQCALTKITQPKSVSLVETVYVSTPIGDNMIPFDVSLVNSNAYITDIARGYIPEFGFDVALLGIASRSEAPSGQVNNPFGTKVPCRSMGGATWFCTSDTAGMFVTVHYMDGNAGVSKRLSIGA